MKRLKPDWFPTSLVVFLAFTSHSQPLPKNLRTFVESHCSECHDPDTKKGGLDLAGLGFQLHDPAPFAKWVKVDDRVAAGEMPPKKKPRPAPTELKSFTNSLSALLLGADRERIAK